MVELELLELAGWLLVDELVEVVGWLLVDELEELVTELLEEDEELPVDVEVELVLVELTLVVEADEEVVVTTVPLLGVSNMGRAKAEPARAAMTKLREACIVIGWVD